MLFLILLESHFCMWPWVYMLVLSYLQLCPVSLWSGVTKASFFIHYSDFYIIFLLDMSFIFGRCCHHRAVTPPIEFECHSKYLKDTIQNFKSVVKIFNVEHWLVDIGKAFVTQNSTNTQFEIIPQLHEHSNRHISSNAHNCWLSGAPFTDMD